MVTGTVTSGVASFNITDSDGDAIFASIINSGVKFTVFDADNTYSFGVPVIADDLKTVTVTVKRRQFTGVTVLGIGVLGTQTMADAPNGTVVNAVILGVRT